MIDDPYIHKFAGPDQMIRHLAVLRARRRVSAGVVVDEDHPRRRLGQGPFDYLSWVYMTLGETSLEKRLLSDNGISPSQENDLENLPFSVAEVRRENLINILAV